MARTVPSITRSLKAILIGAVALSFVAGPTLLASAPASAADGSTIVGTETDAKGRTVLLRQGTYNGSVGFGWTKIQQRHAIKSKNSIGFVLKAPNGGTAQGEDRLYIAYANQIVCTSKCEVADQRQVKVVNKTGAYSQYYGVPLGGKVVGVTTAYCENPDKSLPCPAWVDIAIGSKKPAVTPQSAAEAAAETTSTMWTYEPLAVGTVLP